MSYGLQSLIKVITLIAHTKIGNIVKHITVFTLPNNVSSFLLCNKHKRNENLGAQL